MRLLCTGLAWSCLASDQPVILTRPEATPLERLAAREIRRYVYLRTDTLLPINVGVAAGPAIALKLAPPCPRRPTG